MKNRAICEELFWKKIRDEAKVQKLRRLTATALDNLAINSLCNAVEMWVQNSANLPCFREMFYVEHFDIAAASLVRSAADLLRSLNCSTWSIFQ